MSKIIFRGKKFSKECKWHYGETYNNRDYGVNQTYICNDAELDGRLDEWVVDIVNMGTGLLDCKDKQIFVDDIFKYSKHRGVMLPDFTATVVWIAERACFGYKRHDVPDWSNPKPFCDFDELKTDLLAFVEVVGNVYNNPELLPVKTRDESGFLLDW